MKRIRYDGVPMLKLIPVIESVQNAQRKDGDHMYTEENEKQEKVAVIPASDTVVDPRAMVIKGLEKNEKHQSLPTIKLNKQPYVTKLITLSILCSFRKDFSRTNSFCLVARLRAF